MVLGTSVKEENFVRESVVNKKGEERKKRKRLPFKRFYLSFSYSSTHI
jgi:hypothetical protein